MKVILNLPVLIWLHSISTILGRTVTSDRDLHSFMDESELNFYFGTDIFAQLPDYDVFNVPTTIWSDDVLRNGEHPSIKFDAFDSPFHISLTPNVKLLSPDVLVVEKSSKHGDRTLIVQDNGCHFLHRSNDVTAALSNCEKEEMHGVIILSNATFEILPLTPRLKSIVNLRNQLASNDSLTVKDSVPHFIRRGTAAATNFANDFIFNKNVHAKRASKAPAGDQISDRLTVEVGLFFDEAAYKIFAPFFNYDSRRLQDMLLAYMNGVQALFHHPSIGYPLDVTIVYMEIMQTQPTLMYHHNGERGELLDAFCAYQETLNPQDESDANHWDMGLYVSGLNFYAIDKGRRDDGTMGLATVGGVCLRGYDCVIAEFGPTNVFGKPFPSSGFNSIYILTHEMGHNLGMHHDSSGNTCSKDGYIMSPSRGTQGETSWSQCSVDVLSTIGNWATCLKDGGNNIVLEKYDAEKYNEVPGQVWTAKKQCEVLLRDKDAFVTQSNGEETMCQNLLCRTPNRVGYYFAGPALQGSDCGPGKWCQDGACTRKSQLTKPTKKPASGWTSWKSDVCKSGCIEKSKGFRTKRRDCQSPTYAGCEGASYEVALCNDRQICLRHKRKTVAQYATLKCREFNEVLDVLDEKGQGMQAPHESNRLWMGCAIFCKRKGTNLFYTPRLELNDLGIDAYLPDGTWCHREDSQNYFCMQHHCLPENFQTSKFALWELSDDVPMPQNAFPAGSEAHINEDLVRYLSIDEDGKALLTELGSDERAYPKEGDWTDYDYRELPEAVKRQWNRV